MPGGRRSPVDRALREYARVRRHVGPRRSITLDEAVHVSERDCRGATSCGSGASRAPARCWRRATGAAHRSRAPRGRHRTRGETDATSRASRSSGPGSPDDRGLPPASGGHPAAGLRGTRPRRWSLLERARLGRRTGGASTAASSSNSARAHAGARRGARARAGRPLVGVGAGFHVADLCRRRDREGARRVPAHGAGGRRDRRARGGGTPRGGRVASRDRGLRRDDGGRVVRGCCRGPIDGPLSPVDPATRGLVRTRPPEQAPAT